MIPDADNALPVYPLLKWACKAVFSGQYKSVDNNCW